MDKIVSKFLILGLFIVSLTLYSQKSIYKKDYVRMVISNDWTTDSLKIVKKKLKSKYNIDVNFKNVKFNTRKKIKSLDLSVNSNDGYSGSASYEGNFKGNYFGFYRDYSFFTLKNFVVGYIKD